MLNRNLHTFIGCDTPYPDADIVLFGAPYDSTTSHRPGARFGPEAIRTGSYGLETYSPYQNRDLADIRACDSGDIELPFGDSDTALSLIEERAGTILADRKLPFLIGGEHLVTLGAVRAAVKRYPGLHIVHLDAHADLRDDYLGVKLSHACVIRRCWELTGDGRIAQFGIRSGDQSEFLWGRDHLSTQLFSLTGIGDALARFADKPVYLTIDLDLLDPAVFPGTGTPEPGGVTFSELLWAIRELSALSVVGCDVVELSPPCDPSGISTAAACKVVRELLLSLQYKGG